MPSPNEDEINPYRAPETPLGSPVTPAQSKLDKQMIKKFREQILALGVLWIIIGGAAVGMSGLALGGNQKLLIDASGQLLLIVIGGLGVTWLVLGVLSCMKQIWAVYVGLALSYLSLLGNLLNVNACAIIMLIVVIIQAHRVIGWARQMLAAGVPLTTIP